MNSPAPRRTWEGSTVQGKFRLVQFLGSSDHATVFLTELSAGGQKAAIKLIPAGDDAAARLALWESTQKLSHPNLLRVLDAGRCALEGIPLLYVVVEYAEEDLSQILPQRALSPEETREFLGPTLDALAFLHGQGFVHGAVKPSNIHAADNQLKLSADTLRRIGQKIPPSRAATAYDAPEYSKGELTPAADVWSLGLTIIEALTQGAPKSRDIQSSLVPEAVPEPFRGIAGACLQREVTKRCSVQEIRSRLTNNPPLTAKAEPYASPSREEKQPRSRILVGGILALGVLAAAVGYSVLRHSGEDSPASAVPSASQSDGSTPPSNASTEPSGRPANSGAQVLHQVLPDVPKSARNTIHGRIKVNVRVNVDSTGRVTAATLTSPGPSQYFANLAIKAARRWEFAAPVADGKSVPSTWNISFHFTRGSTQAIPSQGR